MEVIANYLEPVQVGIYICFGLVYCFLGYHFLRFLLVVFGCFFGLLLADVIAGLFFPENILAFVCIGIVAMIIGGFLFKLLYRLAVFLIGFICGAFLAPPVLSLSSIPATSAAGYMIILLLCLVAGFIALNLQKTLLIFFTSATGAIIIVMGGRLVITREFDLTPSILANAYEKTMTGMWWLVILLMLAGVFYQHRLRRPAEE